MKTCLASLAVAASVCAAPAAAQETITLSTWGNLLFVNDGLGLFGPPGASREGVPFSVSITIETGGLLKTASPGYAWFRPDDNATGRASGVVTVDGQSWRWNLDGNVQAGLNREYNTVWMSAGGLDAATGLEVYAREVFEPESGSPRFVVADDYHETVEFSGVRNQRDETGSWWSPLYLSLSGLLPCAGCPGGTVSGSTLLVSDEPGYARWTVSAVPEPGHWLMVAGGLALLAARRARLWVSARSTSRD